MPRLRPLPIAVLLAGALALSACVGSSGGDAGDAGGSDATTTSTTAVVTDAPAGEVATGPAVPSEGCGTSTVEATSLQKEFLDDSDRWFLLTVPDEHDGEEPLPMVVDFHGLAEGAEVHAKMSNFAPFAEEEGFVLVNPHGTGTPVRWDVGTDPAKNPDLVYVTDLLDQLEAELCIDTSRVYATGLSNGAFISSVLACTLPDRFAAVAPVAGAIEPDGCEPEQPVPMLAFHGTADPILPFNGGIDGDRLASAMAGEVGSDPTVTTPPADLNGTGYPTTMAWWAEQNGCTGEPTEEDLTPTVTLRTWDCPPDGATEFAILDGGGHSWPGSEFSQQVASMVGNTDMSIDARELIWAFFQRFQLA